VVRTNFSADFWTFRNFDSKFAKIVAPWSEYKNCIVHLKEQSPVEKRLKTASKFAYKRQRQCSNYARLERTALRTRSVTKKQTKKQTPHFRTYSRSALYDLPQTLHGGRARPANPRRCHPFLNLIHSFSAMGQNVDFWLLSKNNTRRLPLRGILPVKSQSLLEKSVHHSIGYLLVI